MKETKECSRLSEEKDRKGHQREGGEISRMEEIGSKEKKDDKKTKCSNPSKEKET